MLIIKPLHYKLEQNDIHNMTTVICINNMKSCRQKPDDIKIHP